MRLILLLAGTLLLWGGVALTLAVRSDPEGVLGAEIARDLALGASDQRAVTLAVMEADAESRTQIAQDLADALRTDPRIAHVSSGPDLDGALLDRLWRHRFALAPPSAQDLTPEAMAERLGAARVGLARADGAAFGDRLLRDPTGSFARLVAGLRDQAPGLDIADGLWQARDGSATLIFARLAEGDGDLAGIGRLASDLRSAADGARLIVLGPRIVAADISARMERASIIAGGAAGALLLLWLATTLRSATALLAVIALLATGLATALLVTQAVFGPIHVVALGFGGALTGLGLDYPLHLLGHGGSGRARRLALISALTTAAAFLALLGAGPVALGQTGLFVATGLLTVALLATALVPGLAHLRPPRAPPLHRLTWPLPRAGWVVGALAAAGLALLIFGPERDSGRLIDLPPETEAEIAELRTMVSLPSGSLALSLEAGSSDALRAGADRTRMLLAELIDAGSISGARMPLPHPTAPSALPEAEIMLPTFGAALAMAEMNPAFADQLAANYAAALGPASSMPSDLLPIFEPPGEGHRLTIRLDAPLEREGLSRAVSAAGIDGLRVIDTRATLDAALSDLARRVTLSLAVGAAAAAAVLALALRDIRRAGRVLLTTGGALGAALLILHATLGPPDIFQTIALTLVAGIGIDYALFLRSGSERGPTAEAGRSVGLCAVSTLVAFGAMAAAPTRLLSEIGLTVSLGVVAVLVLALARDPKTERRKEAR